MPDAAPEPAAAENGGPAEAGPGATEAAEAAAASGAADGAAPMETEAEGPKVEEPREEVVKKKRTKKMQVPFLVHVEGLADKIVQVSAHHLSVFKHNVGFLKYSFALMDRRNTSLLYYNLKAGDTVASMAIILDIELTCNNAAQELTALPSVFCYA